MKLFFLGTSSGTPTKTRNVSAIALIESRGNAWHLIDCGEGTQHQILRSPLSLNALSTIFITHLHGDHCYGLPGVLASAGLNGRKDPLKIVAPEGIKEWIELTQRISDLHLPYDIEFICPDDLSNYAFDQFSVSPITLSHRIQCHGFAFTESYIPKSINAEKLNAKGIPRGPLWGKIQAGENIEFEGMVYRSSDFCDQPRSPRKIVLCGDNDEPELLRELCKGCDVLVHEATFAEDLSEKAKSLGHSYAAAVATFAQSAGVPNLILTHVSARYSDDSVVLENEAKRVFAGALYLARDFDEFELNVDGALSLNNKRPSHM